ncbi:MAG: 3-hydroxyacyl-CoA dehydrogenase family protein, partial [Planctomycetota bacterium]
MGPIELLDHVGLDVAFHVADSLRSVLPDADRVTDVLGRMVGCGRTGKKAKRGFYDYHQGKPLLKTAVHGDRGLNTLLLDDESKGYRDDGLTPIARRLVYPMLAEAARCRDEGVVEFDWAIDLAMVLGSGFAPHRGGPLELIRTIGSETFLHNLDRLRRVELASAITPTDGLAHR